MAVLGCVQIPSDVTLEDEGPPFARKLGLDLRMVKVGDLDQLLTERVPESDIINMTRTN